MLDFNDESVVRKLKFQLTRAGVNIHEDHEVLFFDLGDKSTCDDAVQRVIFELAVLHYEIDFAIASKADEVNLPMLTPEDNVYVLDHLTDDMDAYLRHVAKVTITPDEVDVEHADAFKKAVAEAYAKDGFTRNENTRPGIFRVHGSYQNRFDFHPHKDK